MPGPGPRALAAGAAHHTRPSSPNLTCILPYRSVSRPLAWLEPGKQPSRKSAEPSASGTCRTLLADAEKSLWMDS